ncbi:MAG: hypothetical protein HYT76_05810 [Deltaproteobacteria bacterium]|nr:hypothetical protein [Deltaproteobacteria bacterium]
MGDGIKERALRDCVLDIAKPAIWCSAGMAAYQFVAKMDIKSAPFYGRTIYQQGCHIYDNYLAGILARSHEVQFPVARRFITDLRRSSGGYGFVGRLPASLIDKVAGRSIKQYRLWYNAPQASTGLAGSAKADFLAAYAEELVTYMETNRYYRIKKAVAGTRRGMAAAAVLSLVVGLSIGLGIKTYQSHDSSSWS